MEGFLPCRKRLPLTGLNDKRELFSQEIYLDWKRGGVEARQTIAEAGRERSVEGDGGGGVGAEGWESALPPQATNHLAPSHLAWL